jgi:putative membrane protein
MLPSFPKGRQNAMGIQVVVASASASTRAFGMGTGMANIGESLLLTFAYSLLGIVVFAISFALIAKIAPFSLRKEIEEDQNVALAILIGAVILGLSIIIASAVGG